MPHRPAALVALSLAVACCVRATPTTGGNGAGASAVATPPAPSALRALPAAPPANAPSGATGAKAHETTLGPIRLGMADVEVERALGPAENKVAPEREEGATGDWVWSWEYPKQGLTLGLAGASKSGRTALRSILAVAPSKLRTGRGIGVGSTAEEARAAYGAEINAEDSQPDRIVIGSIYGGIVLDLEQGRVKSIFYGAAAE